MAVAEHEQIGSGTGVTVERCSRYRESLADWPTTRQHR